VCSFLKQKHGQITVGSMIVAGVRTGVEFLNRTRIQKFWNWSRVGVWKSDSGYLCL